MGLSTLTDNNLWPKAHAYKEVVQAWRSLLDRKKERKNLSATPCGYPGISFQDRWTVNIASLELHVRMARGHFLYSHFPFFSHLQ